MSRWSVFGVRLALSVGVALLVTRLFFNGVSLIRVGCLALALLGFAYLFEYTKRRDQG
ncbi:MAG: hypothetical protein ACLFUE_05110 [Desulfobacteraceae bacterium]